MVFTKTLVLPFIFFLLLVCSIFFQHPVLKSLHAQQDSLVAMGRGIIYITLSVRCGKFSQLTLSQY